MKAICWESLDLDIFSAHGSNAYFCGFRRVPEIAGVELCLQNGELLRPGDRVALLCGERTSAGFDILYPVAPWLFVYRGTVPTFEHGEMVLWDLLDEESGSLRDLSHPDYEACYYGHGLFFDKKEGRSGANLLFTLPGGSGRVIETTTLFREHGEIPGELHQKLTGEAW